MVTRKSLREIRIMQQSGRIVARTLKILQGMVAPGITTKALANEAEKFIVSEGGVAVFKNYRGFPGAICTSVNEEVVHGIPSDRKLVEGDIVSIDIGVRYQGYIGDAAKTFPVGKVSKTAEKLLQVGEQCLEMGVAAACPSNKISDIARAVQTHAEKNGYGVVREYTGHGVGTELHEDPQVPNYVDKSWMTCDLVLRAGYTLAIEPMLNLGTYLTRTVRRQGWDVVITKDKKLSVHFEHSVAILESGPVILTLEEPAPIAETL